MNYLPSVSWGAYGATSAAERAAYYASWGLLSVGGTPVVPSYKDGLYFMIPMGGGVIYLKQL